jgi:hypothetical protein
MKATLHRCKRASCSDRFNSKENIMAYFKASSHKLYGGNEENSSARIFTGYK